jgi:hypothetical protein
VRRPTPYEAGAVLVGILLYLFVDEPIRLVLWAWVALGGHVG